LTRGGRVGFIEIGALQVTRAMSGYLQITNFTENRKSLIMLVLTVKSQS